MNPTFATFTLRGLISQLVIVSLSPFLICAIGKVLPASQGSGEGLMFFRVMLVWDESQGLLWAADICCVP